MARTGQCSVTEGLVPEPSSFRTRKSTDSAVLSEGKPTSQAETIFRAIPDFGPDHYSSPAGENHGRVEDDDGDVK